MTGYLTAADARTLAGANPFLATLVAQSDAALAALLLAASVDVDVAFKYQGRKFNPTQEREFPRVAYGAPALVNQFGVPTMQAPGGLPLALTADTIIWDWDSTGSAAVVPPAVLLASLYQAAWLLKPEFAGRIEAIRSGLYEQNIGSGRETYADRNGPFVNDGLGARASQIMRKYQLQTGAML